MPWLLPASVGALVAMLSMATVFGSLYESYRERHLFHWMLACCFSCVRYASLMLQAALGPSVSLAILYNTSTAAAALLLAWGAQLMAGHPRSRGFAWLFGLCAAWAVWGPLAGLPAPVLAAPIFFSLGTAYLFVGFMVLNAWPKPRPGCASITAGLFVVLGVHQFDYPVLRFVDWFAPLGYAVGASLTLLSSLGIVITYFEKMRRGLVASEERFREVFENSPDPMLVEDFSKLKVELDTLKGVHGRGLRTWFLHHPDDVLRLAALVEIVDVNARCVEFLGASSKEAMWKTLPEYFDQRSLEMFREELVALAAGAATFTSEIHVRDMRSEGKDLLLSVAVPERHQVLLDRVYVSFVDITERKAAERAMAESQERFVQVAEAAEELIWEVDAEGVYTYLSPGVKRLVGYYPSELVGKKHFYDLHPEDGREEFKGVALKMFAKKLPFKRLLNPLEARDGALVWVETNGVPLVGRDGELLGYRGLDADVTERRKAESALRNREDQYRLLAENASDVIWLLDPLERRFLYVSPSVERLRGFTPDEVLAQPVEQSLTPDSLRLVQASIEATLPRFLAGDGGGESVALEVSQPCKDGSTVKTEVTTRYVLDSATGKPLVVGVTRDITDRLRLQAQLNQAQKMETIGTLAGGIAHDFNNILTPIVAYGELALMRLPPGDRVRDDIASLLAAADRAVALVKQILAISRKDAVEAPVPVNVGALVKETAKFLRATIPTTIDLRVAVDPACGPVLAVPSRLHQVLLNLCTNAGYVMAETGGVLTVSLGREEGGEAVLSSAGRVVLTVTDTGPGIPADQRARIFEPYFTTKPVGKGSGLGLAVVHAIVADLGGEIRVRSEPGQGATFEVSLPETQREAPARLRGALGQRTEGAGKRVLVVDDEAPVRAVAQRLLASLGYQVTACGSGAEGLALVRADADGFDAVLTDHTMPGMTGLTLAAALLKHRPDLPILLGTGFVEGLDDEAVAAAGLRGLVLKPYSLEKLGDALRNALDAR